MDSLFGNTQENLMGFVEGELEIADEFLEDAVVHLQLRHFFVAMESLQNASQAIEIAERYLGNVSEPNQWQRYQSNVLAGRERVRLLQQSIAAEE